MLRRAAQLAALIAAAIALAVIGWWLLTTLLVSFAVLLAARQALDDEYRAQRMAVVAAMVAPDRKLDRASLERLVGDELRMVSVSQGAMTAAVKATCVMAPDRWHHALMEDRLIRAVTDTPVTDTLVTSTRRTPRRQMVIGCVVVLVAAGAIRQPCVMMFAVATASVLLVVSSFPSVRDAVAVAHAVEVVTPIGVEAAPDHIEEVVQIRLRHISRGRRRPAHRAHRYTNEVLAHRRLQTAAATGSQ